MNTSPIEREHVPKRVIPLCELVDEFFRYHKLEHRTEHCIRRAFERIDEFLPDATTATFGKKELYLYQNFLTDKYDLDYCNRFVTSIRRVFKWGILLDYVSSFTSYELTLIPPLVEGDKRCRKNAPRTAVPEEHIRAVLPFLSTMYADMLWLQYRLGLRPSEICALCARYIDFHWKIGMWLYAPTKHKTAGKGKEKPSIFDKECQEIVQKYLPDDLTSDKPLFINRRRNPVHPGVFGKAIKAAIDKHGLNKFVLYQARHTACTEISKEFGRGHAKAFLGHSSEQMTGHYDHNRFNKDDLDKLQEIADARNAQAAQGSPNPDPPPVSFAVELPETHENRPKLRIVRGA